MPERWCRQCRRSSRTFYPRQGNVCRDCYRANVALWTYFCQRTARAVDHGRLENAPDVVAKGRAS